MTRFSPLQLVLTLAVSLAGWGAVAAGCLAVGSTGVRWPDAGLLDIRLQSVLLASLVGAALSAAGVAYQAVLKNPLADPYLLGVSSGASLATYLWRFPAISGAGAVFASAASQQVFGFAGALGAVGAVFALASRRGRLEPVTLLLVGVIVNAINGAVFLLINALRPELTSQGGGAIAFLVGSIQTNLLFHQKLAAAVVCAAGFVVLLFLAPHLNVAGLSESEARALGVRIHRLRWVALLTASLMTASAVAVSGPIGFIGLVCPHLARLAVGPDVRRLLPLAAAAGAALLAVADTASRAIIRHLDTWPPVGVLTALLGGPFFLYLLYRQRPTEH